MSEDLSGGCLCGAVRFEIDAPLLSAGYCHCTRCQRRTGTAASPQGFIAPGSLRIVAGEHELRSWQPPDGAIKMFCGICGSAIFSRRPGEQTPRAVRLGSFDVDPGIRPSYRQHVATAAPWEPLPDDGIPRYERARPKPAGS